MSQQNGLPASFLSQKTRMIQKYDALGTSYEAKTKPYKSTVQFIFSVVDKLPTTGTPVIAHAKVTAGQGVTWFGYKLGDSIPFGPPGTVRTAAESDTNLSVAYHTNGVEDFIIEGISASCKGARLDYAAGTYTGTDTDCTNAYLGKALMVDPGAISMPPQVGSPYNLENVLFEALKPVCAVEFTWDRRRTEKIGTLDEVPEGGAKSFLRASGDPRNDNRYRIPEGFLWRAEGNTDAEFACKGVIGETVIIPISLVAPANSASAVVPNNLYLDVTMRLHGLALSLPSQN